MKLLFTIVQDQDSIVLQEELTSHGFRLTKLASTGGFLRSGNTTFLIGVEDDEVEEVLDFIEKNGRQREMTTRVTPGAFIPGEAFMTIPMEVIIGGATVFVLDVEEYIRL